MQKAGLVFTMLVLATGLAGAQQELAPSMSDGPMNIKPTRAATVCTPQALASWRPL